MQAPGEEWPRTAKGGPAVTPAAFEEAHQVPHRAMWRTYVLFALLIVSVILGAWWLYRLQREAEPRQLPMEEPVAAQSAEPKTEAPSDPATFAAEVEAAATAAPPAEASPAPEATPSAPAPRQASRPRTNGNRGRSSFPADDPASVALPQTGPDPVVVYRPEVNRGRVVQLGAFPTRDEADRAWRKVTRRYPYLKTKPRMVNTVEIRGIGGGPPARLYRLQLGTSSQAQSLVICQQLEKAGQSCVVVY